MKAIISKTFFLFGTTLLALFFSGNASAVTILSDCQTITNNGDYIVGQDIRSSDTCFSIRGNVTDLTFDGNGKSISSDSGIALEIADFGGGAPQNVLVKNFFTTGQVRVYGDQVSHITFTHLHVGGIANYGGDDVEISDNVVGDGGISVSDPGYGWIPYRPILRNNVITGGSEDLKILVEVMGGAHPCPALNAVVDSNTITDTRSDPPPDATAAVRIRCAKGTTFSNNFVHSTGTTMGLYMRDESDDGTYINNTFWTHDRESLRIASGNVDKTFPAGNLFENNVFHSDNWWSNFIEGIAGGNRFTNNLFWANSADNGGRITGGFGNTYDHNTFFNQSGDCQYMVYRNSGSDVIINNIFACGGSRVFAFDGYDPSRIHADNNIYFLFNSTTLINGLVGLADWRALSGSDTHSLAINPLLTAPLSGDFSVEANSPARNAGSDGKDIGYLGGAVNTPTLPAPNITFLSRASGDRVSGSVVLRARAVDVARGAGIQEVNFYVDGSKIGTDHTAPYSRAFDSRPHRNGPHIVTAEVIGKNGTSSRVDQTLIFENRLQVRLAAPNNSSTISGIVSLRPRYILGGSEIASASFYYTSRLLFIGTSTAEPYSTDWDTRGLKNGYYSVTIWIRDSLGRSAKNSLVFRVNN